MIATPKSHTHLQFTRANAYPKIAKEYALPTHRKEQNGSKFER